MPRTLHTGGGVGSPVVGYPCRLRYAESMGRPTLRYARQRGAELETHRVGGRSRIARAGSGAIPRPRQTYHYICSGGHRAERLPRTASFAHVREEVCRGANSPS
ncbi:MAG TPA: hypothetical protein VI981_04390 [Candidatus Paceibacterota bacterium]